MNKLNIVYDGAEELRFILYSVEGEVVKDVFIKDSGARKIDVGNAGRGIYFYTIKGRTFIQNGKVIIE
jgi:hypothetical protein